MTQANHRPNPFHALCLPVDASNEDIVARVDELVQTCGDGQRELVLWAKSELLTNPRVRARHAATEPRHTDYGREERWADFVRRHRRGPVTARTLAGLVDGSPLRPRDLGFDAAMRILARWSAENELGAVAPFRPPLPSAEADGVARPGVRDVLFG
ncbi:MAG: hypothetical protein ACJ786_23255 [Catenulispora sp.]